MRRVSITVLTLFLMVCVFAPQARGAAAMREPETAVITIGLIPEMNIFRQRQRYQRLADYLSEKVGVEVQLSTLARYGNILENFLTGGMDAAFFGSFTGALAIRRIDVEPIARPLWLDGRSTYHGHIFVRKDSGIKSVKDMRGKRMAFVERATTAGYIFPMAYLKDNGVKDIDSFFSEYYFTGSHDAAINAVLTGSADVGCAKNTIFARVMKENPRAAEEIITLAESPQVPSNGLLVRRTLDPAIKDGLRSVLLGMHKSPEGQDVLREFGAIKFIPTTEEDYAPVFEAAAKAGIDIDTYDYRNLGP